MEMRWICYRGQLGEDLPKAIFQLRSEGEAATHASVGGGGLSGQGKMIAEAWSRAPLNIF